MGKSKLPPKKIEKTAEQELEEQMAQITKK